MIPSDDPMPPSVSAPPEPPLVVCTEPEEKLTRLLDDCCVCRKPAKLVMLNFTCKARFARNTNKNITFELFDLGQLQVKKGTTCCVSFVYGGHPCIFLSTVNATSGHTAEHLATITLDHPTQVEGPERREGLRIPVAKNDGLVLKLTSADGRQWKPIPLDLSLTGGLIELPSDHPLDDPPGTRLSLELSLGDLSTQFTVEVRRNQNSRYGLFFHHEEAAEESSSLNVLLKVIKHLEDVWLQRQRRSWAMLFGSHPIPTVACHEAACCLHCGKLLENSHKTINQPGFGQFMGLCRACDLYTWYDLN